MRIIFFMDGKDDNGISGETVDALLRCRSAGEFRLKLTALDAGHVMTGDDMVLLLDGINEHPGCIRPLAELVSGTDLFDAAIRDLEYYLDYYLAKAVDPGVKDSSYVHFKVLDCFADGLPDWGWRNSNRYDEAESASYDEDLKSLLTALVGKIESMFGRNIRSVVNFKRLRGVP